MINFNAITATLIQLVKDCEAAPKNAKGAINGKRLNAMTDKAVSEIVKAGDDNFSAQSMVVAATEKYMARSCK